METVASAVVCWRSRASVACRRPSVLAGAVTAGPDVNILARSAAALVAIVLLWALTVRGRGRK